jgi:hypothetical protein
MPLIPAIPEVEDREDCNLRPAQAKGSEIPFSINKPGLVVKCLSSQLCGRSEAGELWSRSALGKKTIPYQKDNKS